MSDFPRFTINRHLIVLLPKQPVLDWIMRVDPMPPAGLTLEELRQEQDAFLVSDASLEGIEDAERWVHRRWKMFFELFVGNWYTDESWWPKNRTLKMFKEWFDVQYHSMVWDLAATVPIEHEDWE
ncbi:hypothetical protein [Noviherbaspirillum galbum]|uniref:VacJ n=1 Tax=Noviherbaspirillum galbum TaxID=2709383 RepID=A0A6B3SGQ2_9BURK|nr:hypothetical protein [Noviherbaspirillum galbum]NEX60044.1 hypothetical protein [Noviherbaspirillum galbum]